MTAELLVQPFAEASAFEGMAATRNVAEKSLSLDARITLRGSEITRDTTVANAVRRLRIVQSACRPLSVQRSR